MTRRSRRNHSAAFKAKVAQVNASNQSLTRIVCTGLDEDCDAPGTWWYVVEMDGEPLVSESIEIRAN